MINFEQIMTVIVAAAPSITAIIGIIFAVVKGIKNTNATGKEVMDKFESLREEVLNTKEYEALKEQYLASLKENRALKKTINELLVKIDRIQRGE
jgi:hypothetical protein